MLAQFIPLKAIEILSNILISQVRLKKELVKLKKGKDTEEMHYYKQMIVQKTIELIATYITLCEKNKYEIIENFSREEIFENN